MMQQKRRYSFFAGLLLSAVLLGGCGQKGLLPGETDGTGADGGKDASAIIDDSTVTTVEIDTTVHSYTLVGQEDGSFTYRCSDCGEEAVLTVSCLSGSADCFRANGNTLTFTGMTADSVYSLTGAFYGNITVEGNADSEFELELAGVTLTSYTDCPLTVSGADKFTLSAKKETDNYINDLRGAVDDTEISAAVWSDCDTDVQGKGNLYVSSVNNNGIHTKDDLAIKNLYLQVECEDNALKGNDSVTVESGTLCLIARTGDGIKTVNTDLSSKGKQRGTVAITGGDILIYAACDGIDAAFDVTVDESSAPVNLRIFTDRYSQYSGEVAATEESVLYLRTTTDLYRYSLNFYNDEDSVWCDSGTAKTVGSYRYYSFTKPEGYSKFRLYLYSADQTQGQSESYLACMDDITVNESYDTIALTIRNGSVRLDWTSYQTQQTGTRGPGGFGGGMNDGNTDKGDHSAKGIKAGNSISVTAGSLTVKSYDDALHANSETLPESGVTPTGNVTVAGGSLTLFSNDDGIHADGTVEISGGDVNVVGSYEGVEGTTVYLSGGNLSVVSSDDGINGTASSGTGIAISGGSLYVLAGGDGVDANSRTNYEGILFSGGKSVIISTGRADSPIDTECGYQYTGGYILAVGVSGGMSQESANSSPSLSTIGKTASVTLSSGGYLTVEGQLTLKAPVAMSAVVIYLGSTEAKISTASSASADFDANGVAWSVD